MAGWLQKPNRFLLIFVASGRFPPLMSSDISLLPLKFACIMYFEAENAGGHIFYVNRMMMMMACDEDRSNDRGEEVR